MAEAFFFDDRSPPHLWIELTDGKLPAAMINKPELFVIEHNAPGRVMLDLTAYIENVAFRSRP